ncbi:MAG: glycosyltransferase family 4 protein [Candidatus Saccharibacteria bacterium]|nr:glycosyltransferase family 4 protein [Candidatus Saccharibacteria bacterium]
MGGTENVILQYCEALKGKVNGIVVCSCGGVNEARLAEMGIKHYKIDDIEQKSLRVAWRTIRELRRIVEKEHITVVHSNHRMAAFYAQIALKDRIRKVATAHNVFHDKRSLTKFAYRDTEIIAVGKAVKENLVSYFGIDPDQVSIIYNTVRPMRTRIVEIPEIRNARSMGYLTVGNVGRLTEQKGMEYFINAAREALKKNDRLKFFIVGDGEEKEKLIRQSRDLLDKEQLYFLGYRDDVQNVMAQLDVVVLSSLWEGFPLTPIEAFSVGKTIIGTAVDGTKEIIDDGENGLLVESGDANQIAMAILELAEDKKKRVLYGKNAKKVYDEKFAFDIFSKMYVDFYEKMT